MGFCRQELTDLHQHIPLVDLLIQTHQPPGACLKNSICPDEETYVRFKNRQFIFQQQSDGPRLLFALHPQRNIISIFSRKKKEKERGEVCALPVLGGGTSVQALILRHLVTCRTTNFGRSCVSVDSGLVP